MEENILLENEAHIEVDQIKTLEDLLAQLGLEADYNKTMVNGKLVKPNYLIENNDNIIFLEDNLGISKNKIENEKTLSLIVNNEAKTISHKKDKFVFVDIFDYIDFDLSYLKGKLILKVNGKEAEYMEELKDGDHLTINWG